GAIADVPDWAPVVTLEEAEAEAEVQFPPPLPMGPAVAKDYHCRACGSPFPPVMAVQTSCGSAIGGSLFFIAGLVAFGVVPCAGPFIGIGFWIIAFLAWFPKKRVCPSCGRPR